MFPYIVIGWSESNHTCLRINLKQRTIIRIGQRIPYIYILPLNPHSERLILRSGRVCNRMKDRCIIGILNRKREARLILRLTIAYRNGDLMLSHLIIGRSKGDHTCLCVNLKQRTVIRIGQTLARIDVGRPHIQREGAVFNGCGIGNRRHHRGGVFDGNQHSIPWDLDIPQTIYGLALQGVVARAEARPLKRPRAERRPGVGSRRPVGPAVGAHKHAVHPDPCTGSDPIVGGSHDRIGRPFKRGVVLGSRNHREGRRIVHIEQMCGTG